MRDFSKHQYGTGLPSVPSDTSEAAAKSMELNAETLRRKIFDFILASQDGATCDEVVAALGIIHQTASPRVCELVIGKFIVDSGRRRKTRQGRGACVYEAVKA